MWFRLQLVVVAALAKIGGRSAGAVGPAAPDDAFVGDYCTSCHDDTSRKASST